MHRLIPGTPIRMLPPGGSTYMRIASGVNPPIVMKEIFGEFSAYPQSADPAYLTVDPHWYDAISSRGRVPILGSVTCNRALFPMLIGALTDVQRAGLGDELHVYSGCYAARTVARSPTAPPSQHAYGAAIDINAPENPYGAQPTMDPRIVRIFQKWGFLWGGRFLTPDGMHFEYGSHPTDRLRRRQRRVARVGRRRYARPMPVVTLRAPLKDLAGGNRDLELEGATVARRAPCARSDLAEDRGLGLGRARLGSPPRQRVPQRGAGRRGNRAARRRSSAGAAVDHRGDMMRELLVGTKKGLFVVAGDGEGSFRIATRAFPGDVVEYAMRDRRTGRYFASVTSGFYGPRLMYTDDPAGEWEQASGIAFADGDDVSLERIWAVKQGEAEGQFWAGTDPAALWESRDGGATWSRNEALWKQRDRR